MFEHATTAASTTTPARAPLPPFERRDELGVEELRRFVRVTRRKVEAGAHLYRAGQAFHALHLVDVGCLKTCELADDGREQVTGFRLRGDLVGVESIGLARYACDVVALETTFVWELPYPSVLTACAQVPELHARLSEAFAREIRRDRSWMLALGTLGAEARVAAFLLDLAERHAQLGLSRHHFILRMCRMDMANHLALKHETVSRALSRLHEAGLIAVSRRDVRILDGDGLRQAAARRSTH